MATTQDFITALTNLIKASEEILNLAVNDESRGETWEDELDELEGQINYARGVLLSAGHPVKRW